MEKSKGQTIVAYVVAVMVTAVIAMVPHTAWAATTTSSSNASITFEAGDLLFVGAPVISFGSHTIGVDVENFTANSVTPVLEVSDARGSGIGWNVTVALSSFQSDESNSLAGAVLTMENASVNSSGTGTAPSAQATITLPSNDTTTSVVNAASGTGLGVWDISWLPADVSLDIPIASQSVGSHQATLTWTLTDAPA